MSPPPSRARTNLLHLCWLLCVFAFCALIFIRADAIGAPSQSYIQCENCVVRLMVFSDLKPLALYLGLLAVSTLFPHRYIKPLLWLLTTSLILFYAIDLLANLIVHFRPKVNDLFKMAGHQKGVFSVVKPILKEPRGATIAALVSVLLCANLAVVALAYRQRAAFYPLATLSLAALLGYWTAPAADHIAAAQFSDFLSYNRPDGSGRRFSAEMRAQLLAQAEPTSTCIASSTAPRSVILIMMESLSAYQSRLMSGMNDYLPHLDTLAQQHAYLDEFHANGFTTDGGLISLLTGMPPLPSVGRYESTHAYAGYEKPIAPDLFDQMHTAGVGTQFFSASGLDFLGQMEWLKGLQFQHIEGPQHPYYSDLKRGVFDDPGDPAFYRRYLQWYDKERSHDVNFSMLVTVSTHPPFRLIGSTQSSLPDVFRKADEDVFEFVQALQQRQFFDHGILVITGDHRSMTQISPAEWQAYGQGAPSRVPAIIVGDPTLPRGKLPGRWAQTDFLPSLQAAVGLPSCTTAFQGRFLGLKRAPAEFIFHAQGLERDRITVWKAGSPIGAQVVLNGDTTHWADDVPPTMQPALNQINRQRARIGEVPKNVITEFMRITGL